jgi:hypothetical protein
MTIATHDEASMDPSAASAAPQFAPVTAWYRRVDVIGAAAVVAAAVGLVGTALLLRPTPVTAPPARSAPTVRDQWYLDSANTLARPVATVPDSAIKDRWYADVTSAHATGLAVARDRWYLDSPSTAGGPTSSTPSRDQWYLEGRQTAPTVPLHQPLDPARDRWYRE